MDHPGGLSPEGESSVFTLKRLFILIGSCLAFCLIVICYSPAQSDEAESYVRPESYVMAEALLKQDNLAMRERLEELQNIISEQNKIQLELQEELEELQKKRDSRPQVEAGSDYHLRVKIDSLNNRILTLEKEKDVLEAMLNVSP